MATFHINPSTGTPGKCSAATGNCPFGDEDIHFTSPGAARAAYEASMANHPAGRGLQKPVNSLAIYAEEITGAREKLLKALELVEKTNQLMNDTANYEHVSAFTVEGAKRAAAVEKHARASERLEKARGKFNDFKRIRASIESIDKGDRFSPGSRYSGIRQSTTFDHVKVGDIVEMKPFRHTGSTSYVRNRALVIGKTPKGIKTIYAESEVGDGRGTFAILDEEPARFNPVEVNHPSTWSGKDIASVIIPE